MLWEGPGIRYDTGPRETKQKAYTVVRPRRCQAAVRPRKRPRETRQALRCQALTMNRRAPENFLAIARRSLHFALCAGIAGTSVPPAQRNVEGALLADAAVPNHRGLGQGQGFAIRHHLQI